MSSTLAPMAAALAGGAVLAWPARRQLRSRCRRRRGGSGVPDRAGAPAVPFVRAAAVRWRRAGPDDGAGLLPVLDAVTAQLRGGAAPDTAWDAAVDLLDDRLRRPPGWSVPDTLAGARASPLAGSAAAAAAWRLAEEVGAPLAQVLEQLAAGLREEVELATEVEASLAAPRATARLLAVLPVAGIALGEAIGAEPVTVLLTTGPGRLSGLAGVALAAAGHLWTRRLVRRASTVAGSIPAPRARRPKGRRDVRRAIRGAT